MPTVSLRNKRNLLLRICSLNSNIFTKNLKKSTKMIYPKISIGETKITLTI